MGFVNENSQSNKKAIIDTLKRFSQTADIVLFGEAFLQGFYAANFDAAHDEQISVSQSDSIIQEICAAAKQYDIAVSFGPIEKENDFFYSSQLTINRDGQILDLFRRVSPGWKEAFASDRYKEGFGFHAFSFMNKRIVVGLCGDLWYDENIEQIKQLDPDVVFWPVYTDYRPDEWNTAVKYEYADQAGRVCSKVLYVNSVCTDHGGEEAAKGGCALFENGLIRCETPSEKESVLLVEF